MHANQLLDPIFHQVLDPCLNTPEFVLSRIEFIFGMGIPWDDRHQAHLVGMVTWLLWQPECNSFALSCIEFMFGREVPWAMVTQLPWQPR